MILETKLQLPSLKPNTLRRERLLKLLKNNLERKLVLVTVDMGYGKTTLLAQVIEEAKLPCVFYDLDKGDSDLVVFCSYLLHGLEKLKKNLASRTKGLLEQSGEVGRNYELLFGTLINELVEKRKEELFFILDDYHALPEDSLVHQAMDYFIDHLPDTVHVVISSRTMPPLPSLSKWRAKQDLFELTREGLRFTEEEVKALLTEVYKTVLSEEELRRVSEQTEGWITGIQLILQSAGKDGKTVKETVNGYLEANQPLFEYFANEIYSGEPIGVQSFLRKSSILEVMAPEACDRICGIENSKELLKDLENRNQFLSRIGAAQYRYHHLFREFLLGQIEDEVYRKGLHLRAADYYQRKDDLLRAVHHYLEAQSYQWAGPLMERLAQALEEGKQYAALQGLLARFPDEEKAGRPKLLLFECSVLTWAEKPEEALAKARQAEAGFRASGALAEALQAALEVAYAQYRLGRIEEAEKAFVVLEKESLATELRLNLLNMLGTLYEEKGLFDRAGEKLQETLHLAEELGKPYLLAMVHNSLGHLAASEGNIHGADEHFRCSLAAHGEEGLRAAVICNNLAFMELTLGRFFEAGTHLARGLKVAREYNDGLSLVRLLCTRAWLSGERGDFEGGRRALAEARGLVQERALEKAAAKTLAREETRLLLMQGRWEEAVAALEGILGKEEGRSPDLMFLFSWALLGLGRLKEGEEAAGALLARSEVKGRRDRLSAARARLLLARIAEEQGRHPEALDHLKGGLALCRQEKYDFHLRKLGKDWLALWRLALKAKIEPAFLSPLLAGLEEEHSVRPSGDFGLRILGPVEVCVQGKPVRIKWYSRKAKSLFCFLALHRKGPLETAILMREFWPKAKPRLANQNLRQTICFLRRELARLTGRKGEEVLSHFEESYWLSPEAELWVDSEEFASLAREGFRLARSETEKALVIFQRAKALWRDEPLTGLEEAWCEGVRQDLKERFLALLLETGRIFFSRENFGEALSSYREAAGVDPYAESAHQGILRCLGKLGKHKELEEHYNALLARLWKDLKSEPLPETKRIYEKIFEVGA